MSIDVMTKVIQRAPVSGSQLTCMLIMANWCNDDGDSLYPSIALLAEAMRVSRSQAQRVVHSLGPAGKTEAEIADAIAAGDWWVRVVGNERGGAPGMTRRYEMNVARLDALAKLPEFEKAEERRRNKAATGRVGATGSMGATGRTHATPRVAPMRPDSSVQPSDKCSTARERTPAVELAVVLDAERAAAVVEHRQRMRKPLTPYAAKLLAGKLGKVPDPNAAADAMIANGWQGFEPEWLGNRGRGASGGVRREHGTPDPLIALAEGILAEAEGGGRVIEHER